MPDSTKVKKMGKAIDPYPSKSSIYTRGKGNKQSEVTSQVPNRKSSQNN